MRMSGFRWSGGDQRTTILGATGSGKSTCGLWMLAHQRRHLLQAENVKKQLQTRSASA